MGTGLAGRVALVVGGGTGIGRATVLAFAREGADVALAGRRLEPLNEVVDEVEQLGRRALACQADIAHQEQVEHALRATLERLGGLHAIVNCAAVIHEEEAAWTNGIDDFDDVIRVNLRGAWLVIRAGAKAMIDAGIPGAVVTVSSITALRPGDISYSTSKASVEGLTRAAASQLGQHGIRVNAVRAGFIDTEHLRRLWQIPPDVPFPIGPDSDVNPPLGRVGRPDELAAAILWLCSDAASYVTGTCLDVDGGFLLS
jgi:NAD(P)-dependent dehydrogenase (short-subunit alcohol dehydrogenase family)